MTRLAVSAFLIVASCSFNGMAQLELDGFLQTLHGVRLDKSNPTRTDFTASETRMQLRAEHFGDNGEFFGRLDFLFDGADSSRYDWELREGYIKFRLGDNIDIKAGRQILTWGTGDLLFINDVFAKDYRSFFIGRDDQYLKAPQNALRLEYYAKAGSLTLVWTPRFEPNRLPTGRRLSFFDPFSQQIVGGVAVQPQLPSPRIENSELALRFSRRLGNFSSSLYFYHGFFKNPLGATMLDGIPLPFYPRLNVVGGSLRGSPGGTIVWLEGGWFDSRDDRNGDNPLLSNSSAIALIGFERQVADNLTANLQWQADMMLHYDLYRQSLPVGAYLRDEIKHLLTSRIRKLLYSELLTLSGFLFYSPSEEDYYIRLGLSYKHTDELTLAAGGNIFGGNNVATDFGQFQLNDNLYIKLSYGF